MVERTKYILCPKSCLNAWFMAHNTPCGVPQPFCVANVCSAVMLYALVAAISGS